MRIKPEKKENFFKLAGILSSAILLFLFASFALKFLTAPFVFIFLGVGALLLFGLLLFKDQRIRAVVFSCGLILWVLAGFEGYLAYPFSIFMGSGEDISQVSPVDRQIRQSGNYVQPFYYFLEDFQLGYKPRKGIRSRSIKTKGPEVIYNVVYTIDENGFRNGSSRAPEGAPSILFFGGSMTFGEGLNDDETFPYILEEELNGNWDAINLAFHGYGPHHMLALLQNDIEKNAVRENPPRLGVFFFLEDHVHRAAGRSAWDTMGPRYDWKGDILEKRPWSYKEFLKAKILRRMGRSNLWNRFIQLKINKLPPDPQRIEEDLKRFLEILKASRDLYQKKGYGNFIVISHWDGDTFPNIDREIEKTGIPVIPLNKILPGLDKDPSPYFFKDDPHLNPLGARLIGQYLARYLDDFLIP